MFWGYTCTLYICLYVCTNYSTQYCYFYYATYTLKSRSHWLRSKAVRTRANTLVVWRAHHGKELNKMHIHKKINRSFNCRAIHMERQIHKQVKVIQPNSIFQAFAQNLLVQDQICNPMTNVQLTLCYIYPTWLRHSFGISTNIRNLCRTFTLRLLMCMLQIICTYLINPRVLNAKICTK